MIGLPHPDTDTPKPLYAVYYTITSKHHGSREHRIAPVMSRITFDAEVVELRLPEDRRIQVKSAEDLAVIARKLRRPILHEVVDGREHAVGSRLPWKGAHLLAVYDGPWVYYCEVKAEPEDREEPVQ